MNDSLADRHDEGSTGKTPEKARLTWKNGFRYWQGCTEGFLSYIDQHETRKGQVWDGSIRSKKDVVTNYEQAVHFTNFQACDDNLLDEFTRERNSNDISKRIVQSHSWSTGLPFTDDQVTGASVSGKGCLLHHGRTAVIAHEGSSMKR